MSDRQLNDYRLFALQVDTSRADARSIRASSYHYYEQSPPTTQLRTWHVW